jgi:predicted permease
MLSDLLFRLRAVFGRPRLERELDDELRFHLDRAVEKYVARGMDRDAALVKARQEFGGVEQVKESCRDARGTAFVESALQDLRYGVRTMRRSPVFAATAVATLALSTASVATVASLANALLWRRLPIDRPDEIVYVSATRGANRTDANVSYPDYVSFRDHTKTLSALAAHYSTAPLFVAVGDNAREVNGAVVSANYFPLMDVQPERGRFFAPDEDRVPDRDRVAVISHDFWRSWLQASPDAVGSSLTINGVSFTIVGIAPPDMAGLTPLPVNVYIPATMLRVGYRWCDDSLAATCTTLGMIGRLAPGRTVRDADAELATLLPDAWRHAQPGDNRGIHVRQPRGMSDDDEDPRLVSTLAATAGVLLLVCCANLGGLLSAQSSAREAEFAVRASLGAGAGRIVRQVVTESLLLAAAGGLGGVWLARGFTAALSSLFFSIDDEGHVLRYDFGQNTSIVVVTFVAALAAGVLFSVVPAIRAVRRADARPVSLRTASRWTTGRWLLSAQAAVAVAMIATAGLLTASARLLLTGRNYETAHVALMRLRPRLVKYTPEQAQRFQREVVGRLRSIPSVESVSFVGTSAILSGVNQRVALPSAADAPVQVRYNEIGPAYFATLRTPMVAGREFDETDTIRSPHVAVVNETLAARLWPDGRALGSTVLVRGVPHQVIGIVADIALQARTASAAGWVYVPFWQTAGEIDSRVAVRVAGDPAAMLQTLVRTVHAVDANVPIAEVITLPIQMEGLTRPVRVGAVFVGFAALFATVLTAIGLYGALAYAIARRTREIGIRLALGAARSRVVGAIVREGLVVVAAGAVAGVVLARVQTRVVASLLYGSASADAPMFAAAAALVVLVGLAASLLPAKRAASIEPIEALRHE